jgi:hypothetical protein
MLVADRWWWSPRSSCRARDQRQPLVVVMRWTVELEAETRHSGPTSPGWFARCKICRHRASPDLVSAGPAFCRAKRQSAPTFELTCGYVNLIRYRDADQAFTLQDANMFLSFPTEKMFRYANTGHIIV